MNNCEITLRNGEYLYLPDYNIIANSAVKKLFYRSYVGKKIRIGNAKISPEIASANVKKVRQLIFEVTQNCNLNCHYCIYNDNYQHQRSKTQKNLDFNTAKKGLDYLRHLIIDRKDKSLVIGFYGGEPLINFDVVKQIVEFTNLIFANWELNFNITTNLTILSEETLNYLVKNKFSVLVSLDGSKEIHDAHRTYPNGSGSFEKTFANLDLIKKNHPLFYRERVRFSSIYSKDLSLMKLHDFFSGDGLVKENPLRVKTVLESNTNYYSRFPVDKKNSRDEFQDFFEIIKNKLKNKVKLVPFESSMLSNLAKITENLKSARFSTLAGTCCFDVRLYIDAIGSFHICEKMNPSFSFGDVWKGFDYKKMAEIVENYIRNISDKCTTCWAMHLCNRCYINFAEDGKFVHNDSFCQKQKKSIVANLERIIEWKEEGIDI